MLYVHRSVNASWHSFNPKHCARRADLCGWNIENNYIRPFQFSWLSEAQSVQEQEDQQWHRKRQSLMYCRESRPKERKIEKLRVRDRAKCATQTASEDKPLYCGKVCETRKTKPLRREKRDCSEWEADWQRKNSEERDWRLQQTRTNQHTKLAVETRREITLQQRSTNQCKWLTVETPEERELR